MAKKIERVHDGDTQVLTRNKTKRPPLYRVILHNDHFTTREFVVGILIRFFQKSEVDATTLMMKIHTQGKGVAGVFTYDIAKTKCYQVENLARRYEMPLKLTMEPDQ